MRRLSLVVALPASAFFLMACTQSGTGSSSDQLSASATSEVNRLNILSSHGPGSLDVQFSRVEQVNVISIEVDPTPYCPANAICNTPDFVGVESVASISGIGSINSVLPAVQYIDPLALAVTFNPSIANGESCLQLAQDALLHNLTFEIHGTAVLVPIPWGGPIFSGSGSGVSASGGAAPASDPTNVGGLVSQASAVEQGIMLPPIFYQPWAGIELTSIDSCQEGGVVIDPPPPPPPPPPNPNWFQVSEQSTCEAMVCPASAGFTVDAQGFFWFGTDSSTPRQLSAADLALLNAAAEPLMEDLSANNPPQVCDTVESLPAGNSDTLSISGPVPECANSAIACPLLMPAPTVVYEFGNPPGQTCYTGDPTLVNKLHSVMQQLINEYSRLPILDPPGLAQ